MTFYDFIWPIEDENIWLINYKINIIEANTYIKNTNVAPLTQSCASLIQYEND